MTTDNVPSFGTGWPSGNVAEKGFCLYPDDVTRLFPESRDLARLDIRGYIGTLPGIATGRSSGSSPRFCPEPDPFVPVSPGDHGYHCRESRRGDRAYQIERALRESEEKYRVIADNATDIISILDLATRKFTYFSPSVKKIQGFTPEEAVELPLEKMFAPESYLRAMAELKETLELDKKHQVEHNRIRVFEFQSTVKTVRSFLPRQE